MNRRNRIPFRLILLSLVMTSGLMVQSVVNAAHVQEYHDETKLMKDFLNTSIQPHQPISFWIGQLIGIYEKKHTAKELTTKLKRMKAQPQEVFNLLASHAGPATGAIRQCIYKFGIENAKNSVAQRLVSGVPIQQAPLHKNFPGSIEKQLRDSQKPLIDQYIPVDDHRVPQDQTSPDTGEVVQDGSLFTIKNCCLASLVALAAVGYQLI
jgi:hypothetical protein